MDPLERADRTLRRAAARRDVVTPDNAVSPMDAATTQEIPRAAINEALAEPTTDPFAVQRPRQGRKPSPVARPSPTPRPES